MSKLNFLAIAGSLRKDSYNRSLLQTAKELLTEDAEVELIDIGNLPHFNEDLEADFPAEAQALKQKIENADGILVASPEYNRSIPGVLKNAIDWSSRPYGKNSWAKKPVYVMGASIGGISTAIAQSQLKHTMLYLDALVLGQPEIYLGNVAKICDPNGKITDQGTRDFLQKALGTFVEFARKQQ